MMSNCKFLQHPFDPLTRKEISETSRIFKDFYEVEGDKWVFNSMILIEPKKKDLLPLLRNGGDLSKIPRKSIIVVIQKKSGLAYEAIINLTSETVERFVALAGSEQPLLTADDLYEYERIAKEDPEVRKLCRERGLFDMDLVVGDIWSYGYNNDKSENEKYRGKRIVELIMYFRNTSDDNYYAHPLDFIVVVDLTASKVVSIESTPIKNDFTITNEVPQLPKDEENYLPKFLLQKNIDFYRTDVKPLDISQTQGPSFCMNGNEISWQNWNFRVSFNFRTGLVLHYITIQDGGHKREVLYRASLSEMVVPFGDPRPPFHRKAVFHMGEYGIGFNVNSLVPCFDSLGEVRYLDFTFNNPKGEAITIKNAICIYEEDAGLLHKHTQYRTNLGYITRSRRLVLHSVSTLGNFEYAFYWYFYQDGTITNEIKVTGILSTNLLAKGSTPAEHGTTVFPQINAQYHQHIFCARLDTMIDGQDNTVVMHDIVPLEGEYGSDENPYDNGFTINETKFKTPQEAITDINTETSRFWTIQNPVKINEYTGMPVAWKLVPMPTTLLLAGETGWIRKRAKFATHNIWVTQYRDKELYAAGTYINMSEGKEGLQVWASRDESIENRDIVLWHTFGLMQIPRVEDFPIIPAEAISFTLKPYNFFKGNSALDVPVPEKCFTILESAKCQARCGECYYGERRTPSHIICEHSKFYTGIANY